MTSTIFCAYMMLAFQSLPALENGVIIGPRETFEERATLITQGRSVPLAENPETYFSNFLEDQLPPTDKGLFWCIFYHDDRSPESRRLLQDFEDHPSLRVLRDWSKFFVINRNEPPTGSGEITAAYARHLAQALQESDIPTVLVLAHPENPVFGKDERGKMSYVYAGSGYGGDAGLLARNIYTALVDYYRARGVPVEQCPGPYCPTPNTPRTPTTPRRPWGPDSWDPPSLPPLDGGGGSFSIPLGKIPPWVLVIGGVLLGWLVIAAYKYAHRNSMLGVLLAACILSSGQAFSQEDVEDAPRPLERPAAEEDAVEDAYLLPPAPKNWLWLDRAVRDEVRQALQTPKYEAWLQASVFHVENRIENAVGSVEASVNSALDEAMSYVSSLFYLSLIGHVTTVALVGYLVYTLKQQNGA